MKAKAGRYCAGKPAGIRPAVMLNQYERGHTVQGGGVLGQEGRRQQQACPKPAYGPPTWRWR